MAAVMKTSGLAGLLAGAVALGVAELSARKRARFGGAAMAGSATASGTTCRARI